MRPQTKTEKKEDNIMETMNVKDFYFDLPQELIAQDPLEDRSSSRLLVLDRESGKTQHRVFRDIIEYLNPGDCLVVNNTKVIPARLYGSKIGTDAKIEVLLLKRRENNVWETLVKPGKKCRVGARISFGEGLLIGEVIDVVDEGNRLIRFEYEGIFEEILDKLGQMPLPPYIHHQLKDKNRYQTVYAKHDGSAAAPTFYTRTVGRNQKERRSHCTCDFTCRTWNLSSGQGRRCDRSSHALGVLHCGAGAGGADQPCEKRRREDCGSRNDKLPYAGVGNR